ncbi:MAG: DciA family protein [Cyanobacteria bacterium P01_F01_bin.143]
MLPLDKILGKLTQQPEWQEYRQYQQLLKCWSQVINRPTSQNTRPLYFSRGIFGIATSSAAWAQELTLQRYSLLKKLNKRLNFDIKDIRFTPARWDDTIIQNSSAYSSKKFHKRKEIAVPLTKQAESTEENIRPETVDKSLQTWLEKVKRKSQILPLCPQCDSPTPQKELDRWHLCCHCMAQEKHLQYRPTKFSKSNDEK